MSSLDRLRAGRLTGCALAGLACAWQCAAWGSQPLERVLACRNIVDPQARLACFDRETATLAVGANTPARPASASASAAASASAPSAAAASAGAASGDATRDFGLPPAAIVASEVAAHQRPAELARIHAHVTELSRAGDGRVVFTLDNGQIWLQVLQEGELLLKPGDAVTVSRGLFHSFMLQTPSGRGCRVTRIR